MVWIYGRDTPSARLQNEVLSKVVLQERQIHDASRAMIDASLTTYENLQELTRNVDNILFGIARQAMNWSPIRNAKGSLIASLMNIQGVDSMIQALFQGGPKSLEDTIRVLHKTASMAPSMTSDQRKWFTYVQKYITMFAQKNDNVVTNGIFAR